MELLCEKFRTSMDAEEAVCMAPEEECKHRWTCMVYLYEKQREEERGQDRRK